LSGYGDRRRQSRDAARPVPAMARRSADHPLRPAVTPDLLPRHSAFGARPFHPDRVVGRRRRAARGERRRDRRDDRYGGASRLVPQARPCRRASDAWNPRPGGGRALMPRRAPIVVLLSALAVAGSAPALQAA